MVQDKFPNEQIAGVKQEAPKVNQLEDHLRHELATGGPNVEGARKALQHECDLINYVLYERKGPHDQTLAQRDGDFASRLMDEISRNDGLAEKTTDKHFHMPAVQTVNGKLEILPDQQIIAEERLANINYKHGKMSASKDAYEIASSLQYDYGWKHKGIADYEKEVFSTKSDDVAARLTDEVKRLHIAISQVRNAVFDHADTTKSEHELTLLVADLNRKGASHINQIALGLSRYDFKLIDNNNGTLVVKSDGEIRANLKDKV